MTAETAGRKVLVRTLPLETGNYGGVLQAYALQQALLQQGAAHVDTDASRRLTPISVARHITLALKRAILKRPLFQREVRDAANSRINRFIEENMSTVRLFGFSRQPRRGLIHNYDTFVSGSDQVFRPAYADVLSYLFDFLDDDLTNRTFTYAASFGIDSAAEFDPALAHRTAAAAQRLNSLSVREDEGVALVRSIWNRNAEQHVDPTLLLESEDYDSFTNNTLGPRVQKSLAVYFLDTDFEEYDDVRGIGNISELSVHSFPTPSSFRRNSAHHVRPSVQTWLSTMKHSAWVATDSFHGCVFSIIFHRPFVVIENPERGASRVRALLRLANLENRMISRATAVEAVRNLVNDTLEEIDWEDVDKRIESERERGLSYLRKILQ